MLLPLHNTMRWILLTYLSILALAAFALTDEEIKQKIIQQSIDSYSGNCPYNLTRNGRKCGGRSAYSRAGGAATICYPTDITPAMIKSYRTSERK